MLRETFDDLIIKGKGEVMATGDGNVVIFGIGPAMWSAASAAKMLKAQGIKVSLINLRFVNPIDEWLIIRYARDRKVVVSVEENVKRGGVGEKIACILAENRIDFGTFINMALPDAPLKQGTIPQLKSATGTDDVSICNAVIEALKHPPERNAPDVPVTRKKKK